MKRNTTCSEMHNRRWENDEPLKNIALRIGVSAHNDNDNDNGHSFNQRPIRKALTCFLKANACAPAPPWYSTEPINTATSINTLNCTRDNDDNDDDHSLSQIPGHEALTCPDGQGAWAMALTGWRQKFAQCTKIIDQSAPLRSFAA